jgi:hypothetical protein
MLAGIGGTIGTSTFDDGAVILETSGDYISCQALLEAGFNTDGFSQSHRRNSWHTTYQVWCDQNTNGGGWAMCGYEIRGIPKTAWRQDPLPMSAKFPSGYTLTSLA